MPTAKKLPSGTWRVRIYIGRKDGKDLYKSFTGATRQIAQMKAAEYAHESKQPVTVTLEQAIDNYISAKSNVLSPSTIHGYQALKRCAYTSIIGLPLDDLTQEKQQSAINEYAAGHSPKSVRNASGLLSAVMRLYCKNKVYRLSLPQPKKARIIIPTHKQIGDLMAAVKGTPMEAALLFASALGLRRSEMAVVKWSDFDFDRSRLHIQRAMVRDDDNLWHIKATKSTEGDRIIEVPAAVITHLKTLKRDGEYIIPLHPDVIGNTFWRLKTKLGIRCRLHDMRHFYASIMLALNVPDKYAMRRMGHSTTHMLKTVYQHIIEDKDDEVSENISKRLDELF